MTNESVAQQKPGAEQVEAERQEWVRKCFQECNKYLAQKGILTSKVLVDQSRYLAPLVALWKVKTQDGQKLWVITGEVPADHVAESVGSEPREVFRHFSMLWQMKAQTILDQETKDKVQNDFAHLLISRAEGLYDLYADDKLWQ